jgi:hypothetical protein
MEKNYSNTNYFSTGAFILNSNCTTYIPFPRSENLFLTQENNTSLKQEILKIISEAREVIKLCSFIITDREIFEAILERAKSNKIAVFILTQLDTSKLANTSLITDEEAKDRTNIMHLSFIKILYDNGAHVRASTSAHAKFIIADRKIGFVMSANLTTPSLTYNTESGLYLMEQDVSYLDNLFDVIFQKGTTYRQYISTIKKNKQFIIQAGINVKQEWLPNSNETNLKYSYEELTSNLYESIVSIIRDAKEYLFISTYSIVGLDKLPELRNEIKCAIERGVSISIFCRGMNYRADHLNGAKELADLGCSIYGDIYNHSKGILNETEALIFTANIDGNHGLINGFEVGYILEPTHRNEFLELHKQLIATSPYVFHQQPSRAELFLMYEKYEKIKGLNPPTFAKEIKLVVKNGLYCKKEELEEMPIFYGKSYSKTNEDFLIVGSSCYKCNYDKDTFTLYERTNMNFNLEKYLLKYTNLKITYN